MRPPAPPPSSAQIKLGAVNVKEGTGTANTSLVYHAGRLLALHEVGKLKEGSKLCQTQAMYIGEAQQRPHVNDRGGLKAEAAPQSGPQNDLIWERAVVDDCQSACLHHQPIEAHLALHAAHPPST
eukprot:966927-Pelagomonas_calceolata.AAC.4